MHTPTVDLPQSGVFCFDGAMSTKAEKGAICTKEVFSHTLKVAQSIGLTTRLTLRRIREALNATETKANYDKDRGKWVYSAPMIDWGARSKAVDQAICILDLKPAEKHQVEHSIDGELSDVVKEIIKGVAEYDQE